MLSVLLASVAIANRTQTGSLTASLSGNNREAREVAESGITYIISEWNRPENRGVMRALQPMGTWEPSNLNLQNPCSAQAPTASGTSGLNNNQEIIIDANRKFRLARVTFFGSDNTQVFQTIPGSTTLPNPSFEPTAIELVVEGTYQRGNLETKATATKRLKLETACTQAGLFVYGGTNPADTPSLDAIPNYFFQGPTGIITKQTKVIECLPLATGTDSKSCAESFPVSGTGTTIRVRSVNLSSTEKALREPPQFAAVATQAGVSPIPSAVAIKETTTISGTTISQAGKSPTTAHCFKTLNDGAAHCRISSVTFSGKQTLTVNTTGSPVYLYIEGNMKFQGSSQLKHKNSNSTTGEVSPSGYSKLDSYQEDVFRFQIRGRPSGSSPIVEYKFWGAPTSNLLFWSPAARLRLGGGAVFSSALFVNSLESGSGTTINLSNVPGSFISAFKNNLVGTSQSSTAQGTVYTKFY